MASDLHIHTTASDGRFTPEEVIQYAKAAKLSTIAITDHDTVNGLRQLHEARLFPSEEIDIIPGVEFSADMKDNEVHILGYHVDIFDKELRMKLDQVVRCRWLRYAEMVRKLQAIGYPLTEKDVLEVAGKTESIGRAHIAQAMVNKGFFSRLGEVFDAVLGKRGPAYVPHYRMRPEEIIRLIKAAGGIAVVAHPFLIGDDQIVLRLIRQGIDGIEVFHPKHTVEISEKYKQMALENKLLITGGSDYHAIPTRYPTRLGEFTIDDGYAVLLNQAKSSIQEKQARTETT